MKLCTIITSAALFAVGIVAAPILPSQLSDEPNANVNNDLFIPSFLPSPGHLAWSWPWSSTVDKRGLKEPEYGTEPIHCCKHKFLGECLWYKKSICGYAETTHPGVSAPPKSKAKRADLVQADWRRDGLGPRTD